MDRKLTGLAHATATFLTATAAPRVVVRWIGIRIGPADARSANLDALKQDKVDAILTSAMVIALAPQAGFKDIGDLAAQETHIS